MEVADVRRRLRGAIEQARREAQERRVRSDRAAREYEQFLQQRAVPVFQAVASALAAEGYRFTVATPADAVRLAADASPNDFIELTLDTSVDPPVVLGRTNRGRGRHMVTAERPLNADAAIDHIGAEDVLDFVVREIPPFVER